MKNIIRDVQLIKQFSTPFSGVFLISDLIELMAEPHKTAVYRRIGDLERANVIERFIKGIYITPDADMQILNQKIASESYISFGRILWEHQILKHHPENQIDSIKRGKSRLHEKGQRRIRQMGVAEHLYFGFETIKGLDRATPEKALLDIFYFHLHGVTFPFDLRTDIHWKRLDHEIIRIYLQEYQNPKFVAFIGRIFRENFMKL
jgi:hypothetical protein